jgi:hypothetical protein
MWVLRPAGPAARAQSAQRGRGTSHPRHQQLSAPGSSSSSTRIVVRILDGHDGDVWWQRHGVAQQDCNKSAAEYGGMLQEDADKTSEG